ncbi:MAG: D-2-hydroxyacid dehydrogenase [Filifactoraceae bacterium]
MKTLIYGVRDYEENIVKAMLDEVGLEANMINEDLSMATLDKAEGYEAISVQQVLEIKEPQMFEKLKEYGVKIISSRTAGVDMINLDEARKNGIIVTNVPRYSPNAIAELAVSHTLNLLRKCELVDNKMVCNDFRWRKNLLGKEIRSQVVGIIGTGKIGITAAQLFKGFGAKVIGYDVYRNREAEEFLTYCDSLEELLKTADVISIHTPSLESTKYMINKDTIALMKSTAFIINTSRGDVINTKDLIDALEDGRVAGAGLDTLEGESIFINKEVVQSQVEGSALEKLFHMDNVVITPHVGFFTETAIENIVSKALENIVEVINTGDSSCRVN